LQVLHSVELVDREPVRRAHGRGQGIERVEAHRFDGAPGARELELQVFFSPTTRWPSTSNSSQNIGCGKPCPSRLGCRTVARGRDRDTRVPATVGLDRARELRGREQLARHGFEAFRESREIRRAQRQPRCGGVPAEAQEQIRFALRDDIQRVAQMQAENGPARAAEFA